MTTYKNIFHISYLALATLMLLALFSVPSTIHAADLLEGGDWYVEYAEPGYNNSSDWYVDYAEPNYSDSGSWYVDYAEPNYSYDYPDYPNYYEPMSFGTAGSFGMASFGFAPNTFAPPYRSSSNSNVNQNTNILNSGNSYGCIYPNSCNTTIDDHSVFNAPTTVTVTNPSAPVYTQPPVYYPPVYTPPCTTCGTVAYNPVPTYRAPYVSLSAVPYTGLELGPVGTALYWSFLVLWALVAAYLIVIKRAHVALARSIKRFLFGTGATHTVAHTAPEAHTGLTRADLMTLATMLRGMDTPTPTAPVKRTGPDNFVVSQINR